MVGLKVLMIEPIVNTNNEEINETLMHNNNDNNSDNNSKNNNLPEVKKESWIKRFFNGIISMFVR